MGRSQKAFPVRCDKVTDNVHIFYSYMFHFLCFYNRFYQECFRVRSMF